MVAESCYHGATKASVGRSVPREVNAPIQSRTMAAHPDPGGGHAVSRGGAARSQRASRARHGHRPMTDHEVLRQLLRVVELLTQELCTASYGWRAQRAEELLATLQRELTPQEPPHAA